MTTQNILALDARPAGHHWSFVLFGVLSLVAFWIPLTRLFTLALHEDAYSHTLIVPFISLTLVYLDRKTIFSGLRYSALEAAPLLLVGITGYWLSRGAFGPNERLWLAMCGLIAT